MQVRTRHAVTLLVTLVIGYYIFAYVNWVVLGFYPDKVGPVPSTSLKRATDRGFLISEVRMEPPGFTWNASDIEFGDAWIEEAARTNLNAFLYPYEQRQGTYFLCFTLKKGKEALEKGHVGPFFRLEGVDGAPFGRVNGVYYQHPISYPDVFDRHILFQVSWREEPSREIVIVRP
jgi:hypothetical protein